MSVSLQYTPKELLKRLLAVLESEVSQLEQASKDKQLSVEDAQRACSYARVLFSVATKRDQLEDEGDNGVSELTQTDLLKLIREEVTKVRASKER